MTKRRMAGGLILLGLTLTGCAGAPVVMLSSPTKATAATSAAKPVDQDRFEERIEVAGGALRLTVSTLKLGPAEFTLEGEGGLIPFEIQGIMAEMGHGWDVDLVTAGAKGTATATWEMDGLWAIRAKAKDAKGQEQVAIFYVKLPPQ